MSSLAELDAMVGAHITGEVPKTYWEDMHSHLRCQTFDEALEAMGGPYRQSGFVDDRNVRALLREVNVYREYSTDLSVAWEVVQRLADASVALTIRQESGRWVAAFGANSVATAVTVPMAICLAGLRACGVEVELTLNTTLV